MNTPEFLAWAIEYRCPIRGDMDGSAPERTERQLRAARAVSVARREGRFFEGLCIDPPDGFRISEALAIYGGLPALEQACRGCPANSAAESLAGCFGIFPLLPDELLVHTAVDQAIENRNLSSRAAALFPAAKPRWYGLWIDSPLCREQQLLLLELLAAIALPDAMQSANSDLLAGLQAALDENLPLHVNLYPRGCVENSSWKLVTHCPRCKAPWGNQRSAQCAICDYAGHPAPDKKRKARGRRPYFPLSQLLGERQAAEFLVRYSAFQAQRESMDRKRNPPGQALPSSPPAG